MPPITFRGGRLPKDPGKRRIRLSDFVDVDQVDEQLAAGTLTLPETPAAVNWDRPVSGFGVLGTDDWGDCVWAMKYHALQVMTANTGTELVPDVGDVLQAYAEATGFNKDAGPPGDNPTDQGTVLQDALNYWRTTGLPVSNAPGLESGTARYRILAFFEVDHTDPKQIRVAAALFGGGMWGIEFPDSAMTQFSEGRPWSYVRGATIEGGHAVYDGRYDQSAHYPVTWGREQETDESFMTHYLDEVWGVIAPQWADAAGSTPAGVNLHRLGEILADLTGEPNPIPPEPPSPHGDGLDPAVVAAVQALLSDREVVAWAAARHTGENRHAARAVKAVLDAAEKAGT
jgi:hypothetical protein